jgi:hypothetical protein
MNKISIVSVGAVVGALLIAAFVLTAVPALALNSHSMDLESSSSQYLSDSDSSVFDITGDLTIEAWVKLESLPTSDGTAEAFVTKYDAGGNQRAYAFYYERQSGPTYYLTFANSSSCSNGLGLLVAYTLNTGQWYHLAVSKSGSTATIYVDGSSVGSGTVYSSQCDSTASLGVGSQLNSSPTSFLDGLVDDVRLWNIARSGTEIADDRSRELNGNETGLVGYWKLNNSLDDSTSNGNTLTNNNSAIASSDTPFDGFSLLLKVRKGSTETVTSSTVLQNDDTLKLSLAANKTYIVDGVLFASSTSATPDIIIAFYGQTGSTIAVGYTNDVNEMVLGSSATSTRITLPANTPTSVHLHGTVVTSGASGDLQLKWAQATSNANATAVLPGSYLRAEEI